MTNDMQIITKCVRAMFQYGDMQKRVNAYKELIQNDFDIPPTSENWEFIDESPEFCEDIRGRTSVSYTHLTLPTKA